MPEKKQKKKGVKKVKVKAKKSSQTVSVGGTAKGGFAKQGVLAKVNNFGFSKVPADHHRKLCSITIPFCEHAASAQRPDGVGGYTIPYRFRCLTTLTALGTNGAELYSFVPSPFCFNTATALAAGVYTTGASNAFPFTTGTIWNSAQEFRIVSFGIIFRSVMTASTAKGTVITSVNLQPKLAASVNAGQMLGPVVIAHTLAAGTEFAWVSKPMPEAHMFKPISTVTSTQTDFDWTSCTVEFVGCDTTNNIPLMTAEIFMNLEITIPNDATTGLANATMHPPTPNPLVIRAQQHMQTTTASIFTGAADKVVDYMEGLAGKALKEVSTLALGWL